MNTAIRANTTMATGGKPRILLQLPFQPKETPANSAGQLNPRMATDRISGGQRHHLMPAPATSNPQNLRRPRPLLATPWIHPHHPATLYGPSQNPSPPTYRSRRTGARGQHLMPARDTNHPQNLRRLRLPSETPQIHSHLSAPLDSLSRN